ncbi:hypothetical protein Leryth_022205 [Lithospermum erythrorhizon]|nr:hypothetical protein Leryth_022205 [Lithospermum erythrorhizon]
MFGGHTAVPSNSPHLRKSGSRPVVFDFGEPINSSEEFLLNTESDEMKGVTTPLSSAVTMPSPLLLWRFKVLLFFVWGFICCKISWESVMRMSVDLRDLFLYEAFLYYNPLLLVTMAVWLWGTNLFVFSLSPVNYAKIFDLDQYHLTHKEIWKAITFADFFLADILTSMSKISRSTCRMVHRQVATIAWFEADSVCGSHSIAIPIVLVLPYLFRLFQCLDSTRILKKNFLIECIEWVNIYRPLWLVSSVVNSLYSFYWDLTRDWDLSSFTRIFKFNKPSYHTWYGRKWVFVWVITSNLILRCTWTYKLSAHLRHNYITLFTITALEILRRFQWVYFRVEKEWIKMTNHQQNAGIPMHEIPNEEEKLLNSNDHRV